MVENWIENTLIFYSNNLFADGTRERRLVIGPWMVLDSPRIEQAIHRTGFRLSCYDLIVMTGDKPPETWEEEFKLIKNYPLLRLVLGGHVTCEEPDEGSSYNTRIDGIPYTITRHQRWTCYKRFQRWFKIKDSWLQVYSISSPEDKDIPPFTFANKAWKGTEPSPEQVWRQAKELQRLTDEFHNDMEDAGFPRQTNEEDKDQK